MGEVSKSVRGGRSKSLRDSGLTEFDSVKKVSILGDAVAAKLNRLRQGASPRQEVEIPAGKRGACGVVSSAAEALEDWGAEPAAAALPSSLQAASEFCCVAPVCENASRVPQPLRPARCLGSFKK